MLRASALAFLAAGVLDTAVAAKMTATAKMKAEKELVARAMAKADLELAAQKKHLEKEYRKKKATQAVSAKMKAEKEAVAQKVAAKENAEAEARLAAKKRAKEAQAKANVVRRSVGWGMPPDESDHSSMHCGELQIRMDEMVAAGEWPIEDPAVKGAAQSCVNGMAGSYPCNGIDLLSFMPLSDFSQTEANDIWGWTDPESGKEIAMMGVLEGTVFVDVSDPVNPTWLSYVPTHTTGSTWRDIKVYNNHAYIVSEASGHGMQVYDLTRLRGITSVQQHSADAHFGYFGNAHNLVINEDTARAYAVGSDQCNAGLVIIDISALQPQFLGCFSSDGYTHDAQCVVYNGPDSEHVGKEICAAFNEDTLTMVDVTNGANPRQLSRTPYPGSSYTHQGWFDEDQVWIYANDELDESRFFVGGPGDDPITKTLRFYAADLDSVQFVDKYRHPTESIDHNAYTHNGILYEANYCAGLRMLRIDGEGALSELAFFDTEQQCATANFEGMWSVYPYFSSGTIVASSIEKGLFVMRAQPFTTPVPTPAPPPGTWIINGDGCEADGQCVQSKNHPSRYSAGDTCSVLLDSVPLEVEAFSTVPGDYLSLNGTQYSYNDAPPNGVYSGFMTWSADSSLETGWRLCRTDGGAPPTPPAPSPVPTPPSPSPVPTPPAPSPVPTPTTPAPTPPQGTWEVTSGTGCTKSGNCIQSKNHPANYGNNEECTINAVGVDLTVAAFSTESRYDILTVGGTAYSGTSGPPSGSFSGSISWSSDYSVGSSGWKLCSGSSPGPAPTPTTPAPSPPAPTPSSGNCSSWCEPPADCSDYPYSCSGCCS